MTQEIVVSAWSALLRATGNLIALAPVLLATLLVLGGLWIALRRIDPPRADRLAERYRDARPRLRALASTGAAVLVLGAALVLATNAVRDREARRRGAVATTAKEGRRAANLLPVVQFAPVAAVIEETTYRRTLVLPADVLDRLGPQGAGVLAPYLGDPSAEGVTSLFDKFRRSGPNVVYTRELSRRDERPVTVERARIDAVFAFRERVYTNTFSAEYDWTNPTDAPAEMRFSFPVPQHSGLLSGLNVTVRPENGAAKTVSEPDPRTGTYLWSGTVPARGRVQATVRYDAEGAREYRYVLGSDRRKIADFEFRLRGDRTPRFLRDGVFPTSTNGSAATWTLRDVLSSSSIAVGFSGADAREEALARTLAWLPAVLALFALGAWIVRPERAWRAALGFGAGLLGVAALASYLPPFAAVVVGAALAAVAGTVALGTLRGFLVSLGAGLLACVFLTSIHGTLAAWLLALVALGPILAPRGPRRRSTLETPDPNEREFTPPPPDVETPR